MAYPTRDTLTADNWLNAYRTAVPITGGAAADSCALVYAALAAAPSDTPIMPLLAALGISRRTAMRHVSHWQEAHGDTLPPMPRPGLLADDDSAIAAYYRRRIVAAGAGSDVAAQLTAIAACLKSSPILHSATRESLLVLARSLYPRRARPQASTETPVAA